MPPIRLSDAELDDIFRAARPLHLRDRDAFLQHVADQLSTCTAIGDGTVARAIRETQRRHFSPPTLDHDVSKYR